MPRQIEQSERSGQSEQPSTLPPPELNPLLNPLLAQNMGRWAEVYFTSAPEKREQAVADLVRELGGEVGRQEMPAAAAGTAAPSNSDRIAQSAQDQCRSCGHENPRSQRFCGMCGVVLREVAGPDLPQPVSQQVPQHVSQHVSQPDIAPPRDAQPEEPVAARHLDELRFLPPEDLVDDRATEPSAERQPASANEYSWVEKYRDQSHEHQFSFESSGSSFAYSHRFFIGGALAVVMVVLAYVAWRSGQAAPGLAQQAPAVNASQAAVAPGATRSEATQSEATQSDATPSDAAPSGASASNRPSAGIDGRASANTLTEQAKTRTTPSGSTQAERRAVAPPNGADPFTPRVGNGSEELALAQRYLSGSGGEQRDPSQAAQWLWKAVAKQNADAIVLLSDLYLKGDGIAKNCDQARVLLDAAARKGRADAGERLRNMQAFGCQ